MIFTEIVWRILEIWNFGFEGKMNQIMGGGGWNSMNKINKWIGRLQFKRTTNNDFKDFHKKITLKTLACYSVVLSFRRITSLSEVFQNTNWRHLFAWQVGHIPNFPLSRLILYLNSLFTSNMYLFVVCTYSFVMTNLHW